MITSNEQLEQIIIEKSFLEAILLQKEQRNRNTIKELEFLTNAVPSVVWSSKPDGNLDFINQRWYDHNTQSIENTLGAAWIESLHPDDRQRVLLPSQINNV